jgi:hypothetical protein
MERELRLQILRAVARDKMFLKQSWRDVSPDDFTELPERIIAEASLKFYEKYEEPIGSMLRDAADNFATTQKFGVDKKKQLKELLDIIQLGKLEPVPVKALQDRVAALRRHSFYEHAVDQVLTMHEKGKLTPQTFEKVVEDAKHKLNGHGAHAVDYFADEELQKRIAQRKLFSDGKKVPKLYIDPIDEEIKALPRKAVGLWLAPWSSGKGMALIHTGLAYCTQGLNVLHITLEDPLKEVENRLDAAISGVATNKLISKPKTLRKEWQEKRKMIQGKLRIIDGTEGGWTVSRIERTWEELKCEGFEADAIIIDYDEYIECEKEFKGESAKRFSYDEIYKRLKELAAKTDTFVWTAAQTVRNAEDKKTVSGKDAAEDIGKIRKVFFAIGIGSDKQDSRVKHLYVMRHRGDKSRFGVDIMTNYEHGQFYDQEATRHFQRVQMKKQKYAKKPAE